MKVCSWLRANEQLFLPDVSMSYTLSKL